MFENSSLDVQVTFAGNVSPGSTQGPPTTVALSIIDSTVSGFARCAGIWYYDPPSTPERTLSASHLRDALAETLNGYRHLCGRLHYAIAQPDVGHTNRYRRIHVTYNTSTDIGVLFIGATSSKNLADFIPSTASRKASLKAWDMAQLPSDELFPSTSLALSSDSVPADAPNVIIQVTTFACGSTAVALEFTHCLADAHSMSIFVKDWAATSQALLSDSPLPVLTSVFSPQLLDSAASGDIDAKAPDPALQEKARSLPFHRFDWYKAVSDQPWPLNVPADFDHSMELSFSNPIPWADWNVNAPVSQRLLHFSSEEIQKIYAQAISLDPDSNISKHDAILAHLWTRINAARLNSPDTKTYLNMTFGIRSRLSPPLPNNFLGSPILIAAIPFPFPTSTTREPESHLSTAAQRIRKTLQQFTPSAIGAHLHDAAFEYSPQRIWQGFLGQKNLLLTTWLYLDVHQVDFLGKGGPVLRSVQSVMPSCDGFVQIMESPGDEQVSPGDVREGRGHWSRNGVDINLSLEKEAMGRLLEDRKLWR